MAGGPKTSPFTYFMDLHLAHFSPGAEKGGGCFAGSGTAKQSQQITLKNED